VIAVVGSIFILKLVLSAIPELTYGGTQLAGIIASIANAVQIQVMNMIYGGIAIRLTEYENHRTDTMYEDALISKTFVFQFVNSYAALFYISFVKPFIYLIDPCLGPCMSELQTNLGTIFLTRLALGSSLKVCQYLHAPVPIVIV
jgi:anoctamin-10/anoctamin-7